MKKITVIMIILFLFSGTLSFGATDNLIIRVGYPQAGENQFVGTVRIYETDQTIDSIQLGDVFTIIVENAEFMAPPSLIERGRFDLERLTGGQNGDTHITYRFITPSPARTGQVIIDFIFDNMRVTGGDVTARIDSVQSGVTSGYFRIPGSSEPEKKEEVKKESVVITPEQLEESLDKKVNIVINHSDYQLVFPFGFLDQKILKNMIEKQQALTITVRREKATLNRHLTDIFTITLERTGTDGKALESFEKLDKEALIKIKDPAINDKRNTRGILIDGDQETLLAAHYDQKNDQILILNSDFSKKFTIVRAFNIRELVFTEDETFFIRNLNRYVPLRYLSDQLNWEITWNPFERHIVLSRDDTAVIVEDYIIIRERSYVNIDFVRQMFDVPVFVLDGQIVIKKY